VGIPSTQSEGVCPRCVLALPVYLHILNNMTAFRDLFGFLRKRERPDSALSPERLHQGLLTTREDVDALRVSQEADSQFAMEMGAITADLTKRMNDLDRINTETREAVAHGIQHVDRSERRIKATITRARAQLKTLGYEDPGLEAEAVDLQLVDDTGGEEVGVPPVQPDVAEVAEEASSIRGVTVDQLRRVRGY